MNFPSIQSQYRAFAVTLLAWMGFFSGTNLAAAQSESAPASDAEIHSLVAHLSDPAYARRVGATRRLCAIGAPARDALSRAAVSDDTEAALRARKVLEALDRVWFAGVDVHLQTSRPSFPWDQSVNVFLVMENRSSFPARIPFDIKSNQYDGESADARQVAALVDASDFLIVQNAQGKEIELRVDEISDDPAVLRVIQSRVAVTPGSELGPGRRVTVPLTNFNRGWARYPLLDEGAYSVLFRYVPEWIDPVLAEQSVGEVRSNTLTLQVSQGAPQSISRHGGQAELTLRRDGEFLLASLTNHTDRTMLVNTNYGVSAPFAEVSWLYEHDGRRAAVPASPKQGRNWSEFDPGRFITLDPGATIELARIAAPELVERLKNLGESSISAQATITASYFNLCDRQWQIREQTNLEKDAEIPPVFRSPLPRHLLATRLTSQSLRPWTSP